MFLLKQDKYIKNQTFKLNIVNQSRDFINSF